MAHARKEDAQCVDGVMTECVAARHATKEDHSQIPVTTLRVAKTGMSVSRRSKCESLETTLSRVEEEVRGIGEVKAMVEKVVGTGNSPQEVGIPVTEVGTVEDILGQAEEAVGYRIGNTTHR